MPANTQSFNRGHSRSVSGRALLLLVAALACEGSPAGQGPPGNSRSTPAEFRGSLPDFVGAATVNGVNLRYKVVDGLAIAGGDMVLGRADGQGRFLDPRPRDEPDDTDTDTAGVSRTARPLTGIGADPRDGWWLAKGWQWPPRDFGAWGWGGCTVPYVFDANMSPEFKDAFRAGVAWFTAHTWCRWEERTDPQHYVVVSYFDPGDDIKGRANVGRDCFYTLVSSGRWQVPVLQCPTPTSSLELHVTDFRTVVHEMFHILGFFHEHQRPDRDQYVDCQGIGPDYDPFSWDAGHARYFSDAYDTQSIMQYKGWCTWYELLPFVGVWGCWGKVLPKWFNLKNGSVEVANYYSGYTVSVGGDAPDYQDKSAVNVLYPPPPNAPPPPPPPQVDCDGFNDWNACLHGSGHPCC